MTGAMNAALAGLRAHMQNLNVIGNNIANVNTSGYKAARAVFKSSIYSTMSGGADGTSSVGGRNPSQIGYGATIGTVDIDMGSGNYKVTGKTTDMMIDGDGFFLVGSKDIAKNFNGSQDDISTYTSFSLTRVGNFDIMEDGYLAKDDSNVVYGFLCVGLATQEDVTAGKAKKVGDALFSDQLVPIRVPRVYKDTQGGMHIGYPRVGGEPEAAPNDANAATSQWNTAEDRTQETIKKILDYGSYIDTEGNVVESDYSPGYFSSISVDPSTGVITANCKDMDDQVVIIGCLAIGTVSNPNGVTQVGDSYYKAGPGSGDLVISTLKGGGDDMNINYVNGSLALQGGDGKTNMAANATAAQGAVDGNRLRTSASELLTGGLEMSTTDLAQEIADMITTQRGYQANTRIIT
ncbi:MAG: flagellar hook-basal body complex protein, partial [Oscillospiraceae bacterium]|nr:flagellar hook-basal body complex protein [Oscillospiraceae bacterium]